MEDAPILKFFITFEDNITKQRNNVVVYACTLDEAVEKSGRDKSEIVVYRTTYGSTSPEPSKT